MWNKSNAELHLKQLHFKIAKLHGEKFEAEENLEDILNEIKVIAEKIRYNHPLRAYVDLIVKKCPESYRNNLRRNVEDYSEYDEDRSYREIPSEKSLVNLHNRLIKILQVNNRTNNLWIEMIKDCFLIEDIFTNETNSNKKFVHTIPFKRDYAFMNILFNPTVEWFFYCWIKKYVMKLVAILLMLVTIMVIWSEMTFFNKKPVLSIFANFLIGARHSYNYFSIEVFKKFLKICF